MLRLNLGRAGLCPEYPKPHQADPCEAGCGGSLVYEERVPAHSPAQWLQDAARQVVLYLRGKPV